MLVITRGYGPDLHGKMMVNCPTFQAHKDLAESQKLDFDDDTAEVCHQKVSGNSQAKS